VTPRRDDLKAHVRSELLDLDCLVVRGGLDTVAKVRRHAMRTHRAFQLDGHPIFGISVFCALDGSGDSSLEGLLAGPLATCRTVHMRTASDVVDAGHILLPTFRRPHHTLVIDGVFHTQLARLVEALGPPRPNPYHVAK
jgi:hypothetical protein